MGRRPKNRGPKGATAAGAGGQRKLKVDADGTDGTVIEGASSRWHKGNNSQRSGKFSTWLVKTYGEDFLRSGAGVLDVAGGKGEVSLRLAFLHCIASSVVDPRPIASAQVPFEKMFTRMLRHLPRFFRKRLDDHPREATRPDGTVYRRGLPCHFQCMFSADGSGYDEVAAGGEGGEGRDEGKGEGKCDVGGECNHTCGGKGKGKGRGKGKDGVLANGDGDGDSGGGGGVDGYSDEDEKESGGAASAAGKTGTAPFAWGNFFPVREDFAVRRSEGREPFQLCLEQCSMVVGMHPDEATDAIVDFALLHDKPFAVVPCCVFPKRFSHRRLANGEAVTTWEQYCEHIMQRDPRIRSTELPFDGRNRVLYRLPPGVDDGDGGNGGKDSAQEQGEARRTEQAENAARAGQAGGARVGGGAADAVDEELDEEFDDEVERMSMREQLLRSVDRELSREGPPGAVARPCCAGRSDKSNCAIC